MIKTSLSHNARGNHSMQTGLIHPRFSADAPPYLFQTKRLTVYPSHDPSNPQTQTITWSQLGGLVAATYSVLVKSHNPSVTTKPSEEAAGLRLELGGKKNLAPGALKKSFCGLHFVTDTLPAVREAATIFLKK